MNTNDRINRDNLLRRYEELLQQANDFNLKLDQQNAKLIASTSHLQRLLSERTTRIIQLQKQIEDMEQQIELIQDEKISLKVPPPIAEIGLHKIAPTQSGIYFIWEKRAVPKVAYVGQSVNLANRIKLSHEHIFDGDLASWMLAPVSKIDFLECYFIWLCKPARNGEGIRSKKRKELAISRR